MTRFIFFCMAFVALSFIAVPVFTGISKERDAILASSKSSIPAASPLSFEEIYEIIGEKINLEDMDSRILAIYAVLEARQGNMELAKKYHQRSINNGLTELY